MLMMHECKRLLNRSTAADGLLSPAAHASGAVDAAVRMLIVPRHATEQAVDGSGGDDEDGSDDDDSDEAGLHGSDGEENGARAMLAGGGGAAVGPDRRQAFSQTFTHRDDWL